MILMRFTLQIFRDASLLREVKVVGEFDNHLQLAEALVQVAALNSIAKEHPSVSEVARRTTRFPWPGAKRRDDVVQVIEMEDITDQVPADTFGDTEVAMHSAASQNSCVEPEERPFDGTCAQTSFPIDEHSGCDTRPG